jgi:hypothetical protein
LGEKFVGMEMVLTMQKFEKNPIKFSLRDQKFPIESSTNITEFLQGIQLCQYNDISKNFAQPVVRNL